MFSIMDLYEWSAVSMNGCSVVSQRRRSAFLRSSVLAVGRWKLVAVAEAVSDDRKTAQMAVAEGFRRDCSHHLHALTPGLSVMG